MGYQFIHLDAYARTGATQRKTDPKTGAVTEIRKWSASDIADEAERVPSACPHIAHPQPPRLLHGVMPHEAVQKAARWAETARDTQGRALRRDGLCIAAGVISLPAELAEQWPAFRFSCLEWLRQQYGPRLCSVVEHTDEAHPHLHFYAVPFEGERFEVLHPGRLAAAKQAQQGAKKGAQNAAYRKAMVEWQDSFSNAVAVDYGLTRIGPKRRRLTREEWHAEKTQARAMADRLSLFSPDEVAEAKQRKLKRDQELAEKSRQAQISAEMNRRVRQLPELLKQSPEGTAAHFFAAKSLQALRYASPRDVDWVEMEVKAIRESMTDYGGSPEAAIEAINRYSPTRVDPARHQEVIDVVMKRAAIYACEFAEKEEAKRIRFAPALVPKPAPPELDDGPSFDM